MQKIRIAFIFTHKIQYFINLLDELAHRNKIEVLAIYAHETKQIVDSGFSRKICWDNRQNIRFSEILLPDSAQRQHSSFWSSWSSYLEKVLGEFKPDFLHLNGYVNVIQIQAWLWALRHQKPYLIRGDGDTLRSPSSKIFLRQLLTRPITKGAFKVTYQGQQNSMFWKKNGATTDQLIWTPCVSDSLIFRSQAFKTLDDRTKFRWEYGVNPKEIVLVVSGKLEPRKRPNDAIAALAKCQNLPVKLWFLGSGQLEAELHSQAKQLQVSDRIYWWGFQNQSQIPKILQASDILIHPSQFDPWPYSILEGAISGLALLLSDQVGSYPDWIATPRSALTFPCGDLEAIASSIRTLVEKPDLLISLQKAALSQSQRYTEEHYCQILENEVVR